MSEQIEMWFEAPEGLTYKITVTVNNPAPGEVAELARLTWDFNKTNGHRPLSNRP